MFDKCSESKMSAVEFTQYAMRERIAPPAIGSVKARIRHASRRLGWTHSRTKDAWYAHPRIAISADEIKTIEHATGLEYGRAEIRTNDDLIARAETLMAGNEADFYGAFLAALRAVARLADRT
jgi:hypothetical protein